MVFFYGIDESNFKYIYTSPYIYPNPNLQVVGV